MKKLLLICAAFFIASGFTKEEIASNIDANVIDNIKTGIREVKQERDPWAIFTAIDNHDYNAVKKLLDSGVKANKRDWANNTALMWAAKRGYKDICELLLSYYKPNMDIDEITQYDWTALMFAAQNNHGETVKFLIEKGADKNHKTTSFLETVIGIAATNCANDALTALLDKGANIEQTSSYNYTPLMSAIDSQVVKDETKILKTVKLLNSRKANVNARAEEGETPLMIAAAKGYYKVVEFLLCEDRVKQGNGEKVEINTPDAYGRTALDYAKNNAHPKTADLIKRYGGK